MKTLKLFNAVLAKESDAGLFISQDGFIIEPHAMWAKKEIISYYAKEKLNGNDLNKTFHKSWQKIKKSTRFELLMEQIFHYFSTYGSKFQGEVYIPDEVLNIPDLKLNFKVIKAYSEEELQEKCLAILRSGIALKEETIDDLLSILHDELEYDFTGKENIRNKEAIIKIADRYDVYPENNVEFFNRFKPLFLAYKNRAPKVINKISKLSKIYHKPLISNPLNNATNILLENSDLHWLENATPFALFKALSACYSRMYGQDTFVYRIRNGKSWTKKSIGTSVNELNYDFILSYLKSKYRFEGKKFYFPKDVEFALPTSEKMFVGNIPTGTRFFGERLAIGIYWENAWGAYDLDLSGLNIAGKIGWNAAYNQNSGQLMYSGDMTSAPNGAVEYLYANRGLMAPTLVMNSVFYGNSDCGYKIVIGKGDSVSYDYMMNPNNLFAEAKCNSVQKQTVLGMLLPKDGKQCFVLLNFGAGHAHVSGNTEISLMATNALYQQWYEPMSFNLLMSELGAKIVSDKEEADFDFSLESLEKDSFTRIFA
ncbi:hypothetical protein [uncultured Chryseobacterium sp.]|uniref:hypothetical protein n=1 Tax=uncultured Chryseobacterium sp. TaxID=259322 RepID=UPI00258BE2F6|nr:hypothetical protein [uncultured Chryseobacterium sp.]